VDMSAPFFEYGLFGGTAALWIALAIGIAFGWCLERSGMGSAPKLAGQFYLRDFTVFKVMFSALVTAMLGVFWFGRLGLVDVARVYVPETWLMPQLVGGLVFGVGFAAGGLCPGTSCVAAATGRGDGAMVVLGMLAGVFTTGMLFAPLRSFYDSTARGSLTLPELLGVSYGVVVAGVTAMALAGFAAAEWFERRQARPRVDARAAGIAVPVSGAP
jgi:uncharacterized protein